VHVNAIGVMVVLNLGSVALLKSPPAKGGLKRSILTLFAEVDKLTFTRVCRSEQGSKP